MSAVELPSVGGVERVTLHANRWVRLPGTDVEVGLRGKLRGGHGDAATAEVFRSGHRDRRLAGWDLRPLYGRIDVRMAYQRKVS